LSSHADPIGHCHLDADRNPNAVTDSRAFSVRIAIAQPDGNPNSRPDCNVEPERR